MRLDEVELDSELCSKLEDISILYARFSSQTPVLLINVLESRVT